MWKLYGIQSSVSIVFHLTNKKILWKFIFSYSRSTTSFSWFLPVGVQSLKLILLGPLLRRFADHCLKALILLWSPRDLKVLLNLNSTMPPRDFICAETLCRRDVLYTEKTKVWELRDQMGPFRTQSGWEYRPPNPQFKKKKKRKCGREEKREEKS